MNTTAFLISSLLLTHVAIQPLAAVPVNTTPPVAPVQGTEDGIPAPEIVKQTARAITVRISAPNNGGSGVLIGRKGDNYLVLTNAHVVRRTTKLDIQASDGKSYPAKLVDGSFDAKSDLALLQFTSKSQYQLADLSQMSSSSIDPGREIYSAGYPFDAKNIRITKGKVSQTTDIPFDDGTQVGYVTEQGEKGIRQGMSGGAIVDSQGLFIGINTIGIAPILPNYTYNDGSKPIAKLKAEYTRANWGIPVYNFLVRVKPEILYDYHLPIVEHQVTPTGYMAKRSQEARKMTVRIENNETGSGAIVAKSGTTRDGFTYYVLTAKHVVQDKGNSTIVTYDQDRHPVTSTAVAKGVDLAVVKFNSKSDYPVAKLNEYNPNDDDLVFVGGFPERTSINSPLWQWQLNPGFIYNREQGKLETQTQATFADRYNLLYTSISYGGMSGGPVIDRAGNIIGIHGKAESQNLNSAGISIQTFTGLLTELQVDSKLLSITDIQPKELQAEDDRNVRAAMENIPKPEDIDKDGERSLAYGTQLYRVQKYQAAIAAFKIAVAKGQVLSGNYRLAMALRSSKNYPAALAAINEAIAGVIDKKNSSKNNYYFWKLQSLIFAESRNYPQSLKSINKAISEEADDLILYNIKASLLSRLGNQQEAVDEFSIIINKQPEAYAYNNRGVAKSDLGQKEAVIKDYDRAIALNSKFAEAYNNRGIAKSSLGQQEVAIKDYDRAIALNPKLALAYYNRGISESKLGQKEIAIKDYDRAINLNPKDADVYNNRGNAKLYLGQKEAAIKDYDRAIELSPKDAEAYSNRGVAKAGLGQKEAAIKDFDHAIDLNPKDAEVYFNRGFFKATLGQKEAANQDVRKAAELFRQQGRMADYQRAMDIIKQLQSI